MKQFYPTCILLLLLFTFHSAFANVASKNNATSNEKNLMTEAFAPGDLSAAITGDTTFCLGSPGAMIVFEGTGGTAPYTITYQVDGGPVQTIQTSALGRSNVAVNTSLVRDLTYRITSVKGSSGKTFAVDIRRVITILKAPVVDFSFTGMACSGSPVQFTPSVQGAGNYTYLWNFGDGLTSTEENPVHEFTSLGCGTASFTVSLTVTDGNGCSATFNKAITVQQKPDISFSDLNSSYSDPFNNCGFASAGSPDYTIRVGNTSLSAGCITSYSINWGDGSAAVANATFPATHTYNSLGSFEMVITAYGANGCTNEITYVVKNTNTPSVGITSPANTTNLCAPTDFLKFEIANWGSNTPGTVYTVDYGDGSPILTFTQEELMASSYYVESNPSASANYPIPHSYTMSNCPNGPYVVTLIATNACSWKKATVDNITVINKTAPAFTIPSNACVNSSVVITNTSIQGYNSGCNQTSSYIWDFGDGTTQEETSTLPKNTSHTYTTPGEYTVRLITRNLCGESSASQVITIDPPLTATASATGMVSGNLTVCQGAPMQEITFTGMNGTTPYTFTYRIDNGPLQTITTEAGSNSATVYVPTGTAGSFKYTIVSISDASPTACTQVQTETVTVVVTAPPTGSITGDKTACLNDASPQITFTGSGGTRPYSFIYTINGGVTDTIRSVGSTNSVTIAVPTTAAGDFKYHLIGVLDSGAGTCLGTVSESVTVRINPLPAPMTLPNYEYCNGETATDITFANTVEGTTYRWTNSNTAIGLGASGNGNIDSFPARNTTGAPIVATITVTPSFNGCDGARQTFTITVHPSAVLFSEGTQTICSGENTAEVTLTNPSGAALSWTATAPSGITGVITSGTNTIPVQTLVNTTAAPITVTYTAQAALPTTDPCAGIYYTYTITVNPRPVIGQTFNVEICSGSTFTVTPENNADNKIPTGTKYTWSTPAISPAGAITGASAQPALQTYISQTLKNTTSAVATATYVVTPVVNGCEGETFTIEVTVLPLPLATLTGNATICQNAENPMVTFTGSNGTAPYTFTYRINGGAVQSVTTESGDSKSIEVPTDQAGTFTYTLVSVQDNGTTGCTQNQSASAVVIVQPIPTATISGNATVCSNSPSPVITFTGSGGTRPYSFTYTLNGGEEQITSTDATSNSKSLEVPTSAAGVFNYTLTGVKSAGEEACGSTLKDSATVTVTELPAAMTLPDYTFCNGEIASLITFTNAVEDTTYRWSSSNPSIGLAASGTGHIAAFTAINATSSPVTSAITVIPSLNGCDGAPQSFTITVYPSPAVTFSVADQILCSGESTTAVTLGSSTAEAAFSWTADQPAGITGVITSGANTIPVQTLVNTTNAPITVTYRAKATTTGAVICSGNEAAYTITVNPKPVVNEAFAESICSGSTFTVTPENNANNSISSGIGYIWGVPVISPAGSITGASAQTSPQTSISQRLENITSAVATATYTVTPIVNGCAGESFTIEVTVLPFPTINPLSDRTLCNGEQVAGIHLSGNTAGTVYRWTSDNPSIGIAASGQDRIEAFTAVNTGNSPVQSRITVTPFLANGNVTCEGTSMQFTITVNPGAQVNAVEDMNVCSDNNLTVGFTTQNTGGTTTYEWANSNTAIGLSASGNGNISFVPVNAGNTILSAMITVTPVYTNNGVSCKGPAEEFVITVEPTATVDQPLDQEVCNGYPTGEIRFAGSLPTTVYQWATDNATIGLSASGSGDIMSFTAVNNGTAPVVATIAVIPVNDGCNGTPVSFTITVTPTPVITQQPVGSVVCLGEAPAPLTVDLRGNGSPSYQWYSNTVESTLGGVLIPNATGASYDPPVDVSGTVYYYCVITFVNDDCNLLTTDVAQVIVHPKPVISAIDQEISSGETFSVVPIWGNGNIVPPGTAYIWSDPVVSPANAVSGALAQAEPQAVISQRLVNTTTQAATVTYTVIPVSNSCTGASFKVTVYVDSPLSPNVTVTPIDCYGMNNGSITTSIQGGAPYADGAPYLISWTGPNGFTSTDASIFNLIPGVYHLSITDARGKQFSADYTILSPEEMVVMNDKKDVSCHGAADGRISITINGGTKPYQTIWTKDNAPFATTEDIAQLTPGTYAITITDANGCAPIRMSWVISQPEPLVLTLAGKSDIRCFGDSTGYIAIEISGGVMIETAPGVYGYRYRWSGPDGFTSTEKNLSQLPVGDYTLLVTDGSGCSQSLTVSLDGPSPLAVVTEITPISCYGANNATVRLDITGGTPPYEADWNNYATGTFQDNLSPGNYTILITDAAQCQISTTVNIPEAPVFRVNPQVKNVSCYGANNGSIALNFETTLKSVIFKWSDGSRSGTTRNNVGPGTYTVYIQGGDLCMINRTFIVTEPSPMMLSGAVTDIGDCSIVDGGAIDLMVTGGTPPYRYAWSNGAVTEDMKDLQAGNYAVTVVDSMGCVQVAQYTVKRPLPLEIDVKTIIDHDCTTGDVKAISTAKVSGGVTPYQLKWSAGTVSGENNEQMETSQSGIIVLTVTDQTGCTAIRSFNLEVPDPGITSQVVDCNAHIFQFNGTSAVESQAITYRWDFGDGTGSSLKNPQHAYAAAGIYRVRLTVAGDGPCVSEYEEVVTAATAPVVGIDKDPRFCRGDSILIYGTGADTYRWNDGSTGDSIWIKREGDYSVTGTAGTGCTDTYNFKASYFDLIGYTIQSDQQEVSQGTNRIRLWSENIPYSNYRWDFGDGYTGQGVEVYHSYDVTDDGYFDITLTVINPNGCEEVTTKRIWKSVEAIANTFTPNNDGFNDIFLKGWQIEVFNRNGILMYKGDQGWDGRHDGRLVDNDTYFVIIYDSTQMGAKYKKSYVTVLR